VVDIFQIEQVVIEINLMIIIPNDHKTLIITLAVDFLEDVVDTKVVEIKKEIQKVVVLDHEVAVVRIIDALFMCDIYFFK
jgi:hypothetical protein